VAREVQRRGWAEWRSQWWRSWQPLVAMAVDRTNRKVHSGPSRREVNLGFFPLLIR
jgi:hypothetical protein